MRIIFLATLFFILLTSTYGQVCIHDDLSNTLRITVTKTKIADSTIASDVPIKVTLIDKKTKKVVQVISFSAIALYPKSSGRCSWVRSYSTGKNRNAIIDDTDFDNLYARGGPGRGTGLPAGSGDK